MVYILERRRQSFDSESLTKIRVATDDGRIEATAMAFPTTEELVSRKSRLTLEAEANLGVYS